MQTARNENTEEIQMPKSSQMGLCLQMLTLYNPQYCFNQALCNVIVQRVTAAVQQGETAVLHCDIFAAVLTQCIIGVC